MIGNYKIQTYFSNLLKTKKNLSNSYIFFGPNKIGKKTFAFEISSKILNTSKVKLKNIFHPNFKFYDGKNLKINDTKEIKYFVSKYSALNKRKIIIIDNFENLRKECFNSLLKVIEEPILNTTFFLISNSIKFIPDTIISRSEIFKFSKLSLKETIDFLKENGIPNYKFEDFLFLSDLRQGVLIELILQNKSELYFKIRENFVLFLLEKDILKKMEWIEEISKNIIKSDDFELYYLNWLLTLKEIICLKYKEMVLYDKFLKIREFLGQNRLIKITKAFLELPYFLKLNVNPVVYLENTIIS